MAKPKKIKAKPVDIKELYENYLEKYGQVFIEDYGDSGTFIFKMLGRKDFKQLRDTDAVSNCDKEEIICEQCVLYPENYDFANCDEAGLPTKLAQSIIEKSMFKNSDQLTNAIHYYRDKLRDDLDEQITCIIHEAFQEFSIEEISNWDVIKTADYYVRAEYILNSLRGVPLIATEPSPDAEPKQNYTSKKKQSPQKQRTPKEKLKHVDMGNIEDRTDETHSKKIKKQETKPIKNKKEVLTPEKLAELQAKFPGIDWAHDAVSERGMDAFRVSEIDDCSYAERALDGSDATNDELPEAMRSKFKVIGKLSR